MKKKIGRPSKRDTISLKKIEELAGYGLTDVQIAHVLDICEATFNNYKSDPLFLESLKKGKDKADKEVTKSLYQRAIGYEHEDVRLFCHEGEIISAKVIRHYPPDPVSMIFWLKNRQPEAWRDKHEIEIPPATINVFVQNIITKAGLNGQPETKTDSSLTEGQGRLN